MADLDQERLAANRIDSLADGTYYCNLCWKKPASKDDLLVHLVSAEHRRRMKNKAYEDDPLQYVPYDQLVFTEVRDGWAFCVLCDQRMDGTHWTSRRHTNRMRWYASTNTFQRPLVSCSRVESFVECTADNCYAAGSNQAEMNLAMPPPLPVPPPPPEPTAVAYCPHASQSVKPPPVWGSRGPHNEVLNDEEWNHILEEFDRRYAADWWPVGTEWEFFDV